jgi:hypothetical protein
VEPLFRIHAGHQSKPLASFDDSTEGASGRRCAFLFAESALHEGPSIVQWTWWQAGERLRARRPHWTMTRGVACWSEPYLRATRSSEERKRGIAPVTAGKGRAFTGTSPAARIQAYSWRSQPGQPSRVERGRKQRSCCSLVCSMTETKKHVRVNAFTGSAVSLCGEAVSLRHVPRTHLLGPTSKEGG